MAWRVHLDFQDYAMEAKVYLIQEHANGTYGTVTAGTLKTREPGDFIGPEDHFLGGRKSDMLGLLQAFLDAGWNAGLRPTGFESPVGELRATKFHLEDMRRLAKVPGASSKDPA